MERIRSRVYPRSDILVRKSGKPDLRWRQGLARPLWTTLAIGRSARRRSRAGLRSPPPGARTATAAGLRGLPPGCCASRRSIGERDVSPRTLRRRSSPARDGRGSEADFGCIFLYRMIVKQRLRRLTVRWSGAAPRRILTRSGHRVAAGRLSMHRQRQPKAPPSAVDLSLPHIIHWAKAI